MKMKRLVGRCVSIQHAGIPIAAGKEGLLAAGLLSQRNRKMRVVSCLFVSGMVALVVVFFFFLLSHA